MINSDRRRFWLDQSMGVNLDLEALDALSASPSSRSTFSRVILGIVFLGMLFLSLYSDVVIEMRRGTVLDGPQTESSRELWSYIDSQLPRTAIVVFRKPFVMSLYGQRTSNVIIPFESEQDLTIVEQGYRESGVTHFVIDTDIVEGKIEDWLLKFVATSRVEQVWRNSRFIVYGWKK